MEELFTLAGLSNLLTLSLMEIVLGVDNILFISIITERLPIHQRKKTRTTGILLALITRIALLFSITWLIGLQQTLFQWQTVYFNLHLNIKDLILLFGGFFLMVQSFREILKKIKAEPEKQKKIDKKISAKTIILQIILIDLVFSFDSILTAVGLVRNVWIMIFAVIISMFVMIFAADKIAKLLHQYEELKILALVFLIGIGGLLVLEAVDISVSKGYLYTSIAFASFVEWVHIQIRKQKKNNL